MGKLVNKNQNKLVRKHKYIVNSQRGIKCTKKNQVNKKQSKRKGEKIPVRS